MAKKGNKRRPKLNPKQKRFVEEYLVDLNGTKAAIRAGYSKRTAVKIATENLTKPLITEAIQRAIQERSERTEITQDEIVKDLQDLRDEARGAEQFAPAVRCDELLGKHLGMFKERVEHSGKLNIENPMALAASILNVKVESKSGKEQERNQTDIKEITDSTTREENGG